MKNTNLTRIVLSIGLLIGILFTTGCDPRDEDNDSYEHIEGIWTISGLGECDIEQHGSRITIYTSFETYTGSVDDNKISFSATVEQWLHTYEGVINRDSMAGTVDYDATHLDSSKNIGTWTATRK